MLFEILGSILSDFPFLSVARDLKDPAYNSEFNHNI